MLDFFIVATSLIDLALVGVDLPFIKVLRLLRTLRPLRFISHNVAMKMVIAALFDSVGSIFNVVIVVIIVWLMFAILGVNLLAGKFFECTVFTYEVKVEEECLLRGGEWVNKNYNFDNVGTAMLTLFVVSTLEGWPNVMYKATESTDVDRGPRIGNSPFYAYYFIAFILIGTYFFLNFFIGVLFLKYT